MSPTKRTAAIGLSAVGAAAVLVLGANFVANAAGASSTPSPSTTTTSPSTTSGTTTQNQPPAGAPRGPGDATHAGPGETLLTGSTLASVKAAALAAVPGATVVRAETDSGPAKYEVHLTTTAGATKTVKVNADFTVAAVQDGMGVGPAGAQGHPQGPPPGAPSGSAPSTSSSSAA